MAARLESHIQIHCGHAPLSSSSHFSMWTLRVWSPVSGLYHTDNEGPGEVRVQIHRQYTSILNLLRRESIPVPPVEDQCKFVTVFDKCLEQVPPTSDTFLSVPYAPVTCNLISAPFQPLDRLYLVSCRGLIYCFPPWTLALRTPFTPS